MINPTKQSGLCS